MPITREELPVSLGPSGAAWIEDALADAREAARTTLDAVPRHGVPKWELRFAAAGRECGSSESAQVARVLLLRTARPDAAAVRRLYERGTGAERRAVLLALPHLGLTPEEGVALVEDALRANDTGLVAAAVGPFAAAHLDAHAWRHAVLKCLFTGVPLAAVAGLADRARGDRELARMLGDFAAERTAAERAVPSDLDHALALTTKEV
ncbi:EboA domain-containing protein [Streptomyces laculatispora]|uniref:EboA domain-containing protein n=1 Tax=Streptomyces laculatispora TaxID=887464 RepID=UPI001A949655|nr:EboA domain-containing protein [Streptomyces laculatispora]MBO0916164.1 EboA domain-containing protein [Streptomyces laculatispora]